MLPTLEQRIVDASDVPASWDPIKGGKRSWLHFEDDKSYYLGKDAPDTFEAIADRMICGNYYPPDCIVFHGAFRSENRPLRVGDRVVQRARILPFLHNPAAWSVVEIFRAERSGEACAVGYVTTKAHHGRGIWLAELTRNGGKLNLRVRSTASPNSWLFWLGLPVARFLQVRARVRAVAEFRKLVA